LVFVLFCFLFFRMALSVTTSVYMTSVATLPVVANQFLLALALPCVSLRGLKLFLTVVYLPTLKGDVFVRESYHSANKRDHRI